MAKPQKRLTKREIKEDKVAEFLVRAVNDARKHSRKLTGAMVVVLIGAVVATIAVRQRRAAGIEAQTMLARASFDLRQGNLSSAMQAYASIMDRYGSTRSGADAVFFCANAYFATGRFDSATFYFERYLNLRHRREAFTVSAKQGIAQSLEQAGRFAEAAENYLKVQREHPADPLAPDAIFGAARCYALAGNLRAAETAYGDLMRLYPGSRQASIAKMPLLEIQAKLENS